MCTVCGCGQSSTSETDVHDHHTDADAHAGLHHHYGKGEAHTHVPGMSQSRIVSIEQDILAKNNHYAEHNRDYFQAHRILAINLVSAPGSGKTTLLVNTLNSLAGIQPASVIEGDQQTTHDADRIRATGTQALQVNTGKGCHLDAHQIGHAVADLEPDDESILFIENVGNLVCPAGFDLGEAFRVVILSTTEGEDKPLKYPDMFHSADLLLLNKSDLLPYLDFDAEQCVKYARQVNPGLEALTVSATTGEGMDRWLSWLQVKQRELAVQTV